MQFLMELLMSYTSSRRQFFFWFCVVALWSVVTLWWTNLRESVLCSFGINLFFNKQILIMLYLTTKFFVFSRKSSSKISNISESALKSASLLIFSKISGSAEKSAHLGTLSCANVISTANTKEPKTKLRRGSPTTAFPSARKTQPD